MLPKRLVCARYYAIHRKFSSKPHRHGLCFHGTFTPLGWPDTKQITSQVHIWLQNWNKCYVWPVSQPARCPQSVNVYWMPTMCWALCKALWERLWDGEGYCPEGTKHTAGKEHLASSPWHRQLVWRAWPRLPLAWVPTCSLPLQCWSLEGFRGWSVPDRASCCSSSSPGWASGRQAGLCSTPARAWWQWVLRPILRTGGARRPPGTCSRLWVMCWKLPWGTSQKSLHRPTAARWVSRPRCGPHANHMPSSHQRF